ncbi:MAG: hypothetical protein OHK0013_37500 [Sandaracinaceae bacterium]
MTMVREIAGVGTVRLGDVPTDDVRVQVREVQKGLNDLVGWARVRTDGVIDAEVAAQVRRFQGSVGLPETGDIDHETIEALNRALAQTQGSREAQRAVEAEVSERIPGSAAVQDAARATLHTVGRSAVDSTARAVRTYASEQDAEVAFARDAARLFDVHRWDELSGAENAHFELFDRDGRRVTNRLAREGDYVRIQLPGVPGDDWVQIERARQSDTSASITVRPSLDPTDPNPRRDRVDHFFTAEATNTFSLERHGATVTARVDGRNERPNVGRQSDDLLHAIRNRVVVEGAWGLQARVPGTGVLVGGMQQHQWNRFTANLVSDR